MSRAGARLMFDPAHAYVEPDPAGEVGGFDFGPIAGSYLTDIPYKPEFRSEYAATVARTKAGLASDPVGAGCRPYGMPRVMSATPYGPSFLITPEIIVILLGDETRRIYMDARPHPGGDDAVSSWEGHSVGRWDGEMLVIDTASIYAGNYDQSNARHSDQIHVVELIRQIDQNTLENQITVEDPVMLTEPWTVHKQYKRARTRYPNVSASNCGPEQQVDLIGGAQVPRLPFK
jgi:hypothetical protein